MASDTILCPIKGLLPAPVCPPGELEPLLEALRANQAVAEPRAFPRGTLLPDGRLDLCKQGLGVDGCKAVTVALAGNTVVRSLLLGTNGIGDEGAAAVAQLLSVNRTLEVAYLGCNGIGAAGTERLTCAVADNPNVSGLWLKRNPIGPGGLRAVAELIRRGTALRVLDLVNACPGEPAVGEVIAALADSPSAIEAVYLGGNALGPAVAESLAELVAGNWTLRGLFLSVNKLGDAGAVRLAEGLARNAALTALSVASNGLSGVGIAAVARSLCGHPRLEWLDFGYQPSTRVLGCAANTVDEPAVEALADLIAATPSLMELNLTRTGVGRTELDELLARRRAERGWTPPLRPDVALIRSVYR